MASGSSGTKRPLGTFRDEKGISFRFQVSISSLYDLSRCKPHAFLHIFQVSTYVAESRYLSLSPITGVFVTSVSITT